MKKKSLAISLITLTLILLSAVPAIASALYRADIRVTNSGNSTVTDATANFTLNSAAFVANGYALADFSDVSIQSNDVQLAFMPGYSSNPWIIYVPLIYAGQSADYSLYAKGATGGKICYFPGDAGMTIPDDDTLEIGNEFQWLITDCFLDTTAGAGKYIIYKNAACSLIVSASTTGTITFAIVGGASVSTTSIPSGEYDIEVTANVTHLKLYLNSVLKATSVMTASVPTNGSDWVFFSGNSTKYVNSLKLIK